MKLVLITLAILPYFCNAKINNFGLEKTGQWFYKGAGLVREYLTAELN